MQNFRKKCIHREIIQQRLSKKNKVRSSMRVLSHVQLFAIPQTVARQIPLSMEFSRQEYWSGLTFPTPGDLPNPGIEPTSPALAGRFFTTAHLGSHLLKKQGDLHLNTANILSNTLCFTHKVKNTRVHRKQFNNPSSTTATTASKSSN